jgi:exodeoxyribonuclease VII small subunit
MTKQDKNLQETLQELKGIITELEKSEDVDVEAGLAQVKEGAKLVKNARKRFGELENEFTDIKKDLEE